MIRTTPFVRSVGGWGTFRAAPAGHGSSAPAPASPRPWISGRAVSLEPLHHIYRLFLQKTKSFCKFFCSAAWRVCLFRFSGILTHAGFPGERRSLCPLHFLNSAPPPRRATAPCGSALTCAPDKSAAMNFLTASCRMAASRSGPCWAFPVSGTAAICFTGGPPWTITGPAGF